MGHAGLRDRLKQPPKNYTLEHAFDKAGEKKDLWPPEVARGPASMPTLVFYSAVWPQGTPPVTISPELLRISRSGDFCG